VYGDEFEVLSVSEFCGETLIVVLDFFSSFQENWVCWWKLEREKKGEDINETCNASDEIDLLYMHKFF